MKTILFATLALLCAVANARSYKCPLKAEGIQLTNARISIGAADSHHALHGDVEQVQGGTNIRYHVPEEAPRWLVCQYGGKRIEGTAISGPEVVGGRNVRVPLDPMASVCDLVIRTAKSQGGPESNWTAAVTCTRKPPPPPDMM